MPLQFVRACVDFDPAGNPFAWSYECHDRDDGIVAFGCGNGSPFETADEYLKMALQNAWQRTGLVQTLFDM